MSDEDKGVADDPNPDYTPPTMRWDTVEIMSPEGYSFTVVRDDGGVLGIAFRPPNGEWSTKSVVESFSTVLPGHKVFKVISG